MRAKPSLKQTAEKPNRTLNVSGSVEHLVEEAVNIVMGSRAESYGHPADNLKDIADSWSAYLHARKLLPRLLELDPRDVAQMMVLTKIIRDGHAIKRDNLVDQIGYTLTIARLEERHANSTIR